MRSNPVAPNHQRRRLLLAGGAALGLAAAPTVQAAPATVTVVTSYPDEFVSRIQAAFEKANPGTRLQVIWRMPHDAIDYLSAENCPADVYWAASPRTFARLADLQIWQKIPVDRAQRPQQIGHTALGDPAGYYTATELAGFGFAVSPQALAQQQLPMPADWPDLADPRYAGQIALPVPARVGFAPPIVEIVLQAYGWSLGWALWSEIAANAHWIDRGATFVSDEVGSGRRAIGVSIDFFVNSAIANGAPLSFLYPRHTGLNPAHIAMTRHAPNPAGARAFVEFMLSASGQRQLLHPDIRRLPVRPDAYANQPASQFNPFAAAQAGNLNFDSDRARPRLATSAALFQQMLVAPSAEMKSLWQRLRAAEAAGKDVRAVRTLLGTPPIDEASANDPAVQQQLGQRLEGSDADSLGPLERAWADSARRIRAQADRALAEVKA